MIEIARRNLELRVGAKVCVVIDIDSMQVNRGDEGTVTFVAGVGHPGYPINVKLDRFNKEIAFKHAELEVIG